MTVAQRILSSIPAIHCQWLCQEDIPVTVIINHRKQGPTSQTHIILPEPIIISASIPDAKGHWEMETYCLSRQFEKDYLQATIEAFKVEAPEHPGILPMQDLLNASKR
jgi:hypothetical protein